MGGGGRVSGRGSVGAWGVVAVHLGRRGSSYFAVVIVDHHNSPWSQCSSWPIHPQLLTFFLSFPEPPFFEAPVFGDLAFPGDFFGFFIS